MKKLIEIDGKQVPFESTAGTPRRYRNRFSRDFLVDFRKLESELNSRDDLTSEALTIFENVAFTMAKQADPGIPEDPDDWLDEFETFSIYLVLPEIVKLWKLSELPTAEQKKKQE